MTRRSMRPAEYHKLSAQAKARRLQDSLREPPLRCPRCEMAVQPDDLLAHLRERCEGPQKPHQTSMWIPWRAAIRIVRRRTLARWVRSGDVRVRGKARHQGARSARKEYLLRDIVSRVALRTGKQSST